jgi:excisionase family DNA binding protein
MPAHQPVPATTLHLLAPSLPRGQRTHRTDPHDVIDLTVRADNRLLLTVEEAADRLGIGRSLMYELIRTREIVSVQVGRLRRVPTESLTEYVAAMRLQAQPPDPAA